jgi:hypothetical protein
MTREEYARKYAGGYNRTGQPVRVPEDVQRAEHHEPCFYCGTARGCRHRVAA